MDSSRQTGSGLTSAVTKPAISATGHVDRYITFGVPGGPGYSNAYGRVTVEEAKALIKSLGEAIKAATA